MRILSEFHDYYDVVQSTGQDQTVLYVRKPQEVELAGGFPFPKCRAVRGEGFYSPTRQRIDIDQFIVGFCGKIYPLLRLHHGASPLCYTFEEVDQYLQAHLTARELEGYKSKRRHKHWHWLQKRTDFKKFFDECDQKKASYEKLFIDNKSPVFTAQYHGPGRRLSEKTLIMFNACLKDYEFFRLFDTYTAYQEVAMFVGGVLAFPGRTIPDVSDKDLAQAKGFDDWSFRKPPCKRG